jgi:hypothetical protein
MAVRLSALHTGLVLIPRNSFLSVSGTDFCQRLSKPQGLVRMKGFGKLKKIHSPRITRIIKSRWLKLAMRVACILESLNVYKILVGK